MRKQPWCDGRIAMTGGSYFGQILCRFTVFHDTAHPSRLELAVLG